MGYLFDSIPRMDNIELVESYLDFFGYLVIKLDTSSFYKSFKKDDKTINILKANMYWIDSLPNIERDSAKYYHTEHVNLILSVAELTDTALDKSPWRYFLKYFNLIQRANNGNLKTYLYDDYLGPTEELFKINKSLWKIRLSKASYLVFRTHFVTAILRFNFANYSRLIFLPISFLKELSPIAEEEALKNHLLKSEIKIKLE